MNTDQLESLRAVPHKLDEFAAPLPFASVRVPVIRALAKQAWYRVESTGGDIVIGSGHFLAGFSSHDWPGALARTSGMNEERDNGRGNPFDGISRDATSRLPNARQVFPGGRYFGEGLPSGFVKLADPVVSPLSNSPVRCICHPGEPSEGFILESDGESGEVVRAVVASHYAGPMLSAGFDVYGEPRKSRGDYSGKADAEIRGYADSALILARDGAEGFPVVCGLVMPLRMDS